MRKLYCISLLLCLSLVLQAQEAQDKVRMLVEDYVSQNEDGIIDAELLYETFYELSENPININNADAEELERIPFLSPHQVNALADYIKRHGEIKSIYELQGVYAFDRNVIENISPFITFSEVTKDYKRRMYFKHDVLVRSTTVVEDQLGYTRPDSLTHYQGPSYSAMLKYKGAMGKKFSWHLTAEQDRGEAWFDHSNTTDFLSGGLQYTGDGVVQNVIIGDFRMRFGQGLAVNNNFGYGKSSQVMDVIQKGAELRRFTSSSEYSVFRGAATQLSFGDFDLVIGGSSRLADASLDSVDNDVVIRSFPETGFHRTASEVEKYRAARVNDAMVHLDYTYDKLKVGATFIGQKLSNTFAEDDRWDNYFSPTYQQYYNATLDYKWKFKGMMFFGEIATDKQGGWAGIQGFSVSPSSRVGMSLVYRNYSKDYFALYGQAFGEGSQVNNEEGLYMGTNILIAKGWSVDAYLDWYRFPWLRYGIARPTSGYDLLLQPKFSPSRTTTMHWRVKYEEKEANLNNDSPLNQVVNTQRLDMRYHLSTRINDYISLQSRIATSHVLHLDDEQGYLIYQDVTAKLLQQKLSMTLRYSLFNTSSYESRIYTYESDVLYLSSTPASYGRGSRTYLNMNYKMNDTFTFYLKTSYSKTFDDRTLGSSLDAIDADHKTDIHFQVRIKL